MDRLNLLLPFSVINGLLIAVYYFWKRYSQRLDLVNEACSSDSDNSEDENLTDEDTTCVPKETQFGIITNVFDSFGLIDKKIYFDFKTLIGVEKPREGLMVRVTLGNSVNGQKLVAERVEVMWECWDQEDGLHCSLERMVEPKEEATIGEITKITDKNVCWINNEFSIDLNETNVVNLRPCVGDWVSVTRTEIDDSSQRYNIKFLRSREFTGEITSVDEKIVVIDCSIYAILDCCDIEYVPSVGDQVKGVVIESTFKDFEWRATGIVPQITAADLIYQKHMAERMQAIGQMVTDKNGVSITSPIDFGTVNTDQIQILVAHIRNNGDKLLPIPKCSFTDNCQGQLNCENAVHLFDPHKRLIKPGEEATVKISCTPKLLGTFKYTLKFDFADFYICRLVAFKSEDPRQNLLKNGSGHHVNRRRSDRNDARPNAVMGGSYSSKVTIQGRKVQSAPQVRKTVYILRFPVPDKLWECHRGERDLLTWVPCLGSELNWKNYKEKFSNLLHLEEIQQVEDMAQFTMERVHLKEEEAYLVLEVPNLSEGRPSLMVGDQVNLTDPDDDSEPLYIGYVHVVRNDEILLQFDKSYHDQFNDKEVTITFPISRTTFRRCHQAVHLFHRIGSKVLFPVRTELQPVRMKFNPKNAINRSLNERQLCAVSSILSGRHVPAPYIIYGPPGTGKTVTVIEAILQVFTLRSDSRILVCAPSNSAADLLCERLHLSGCVTAGDLVRVNAAHRLNKVNETIVDCMNICFSVYGFIKELPSAVQPYSHSALPMEHVIRYRIIVCTCVSAGMLFEVGIGPGHFTHVFIDEAGQANESEALIPVSVTAAQNITDFQMILAGDPQQLGPVIRSKLACIYGLQTSLLERLCKSELYLRDESQPGSYDPNYVTKLIYNYRSHPAFIEVPNRLFYHSELVPKASPTLIHELLHWPHLTNKDMPILFHGIRSQDLQEYDSPSWFNPEEVLQVVIYLQSLYKLDIPPADIGIITPYRRQVEKINQMLRALAVPSPKVGSVEEFQGQERKVIIVTTVRSSDDWLLFDEHNNMGFLSNPKRFNVTITRAEALLVIVGNPFILLKDFNWRTLLLYCIQNNAYVGVDRDELQKLMLAIHSDSTSRRLDSLICNLE